MKKFYYKENYFSFNLVPGSLYTFFTYNQHSVSAKTIHVTSEKE